MNWNLATFILLLWELYSLIMKLTDITKINFPIGSFSEGKNNKLIRGSKIFSGDQSSKNIYFVAVDICGETTSGLESWAIGNIYLSPNFVLSFKVPNIIEKNWCWLPFLESHSFASNYDQITIRIWNWGMARTRGRSWRWRVEKLASQVWNFLRTVKL